MRNIILVTSTFPYDKGESFLETELQFFAQRKDVSLTLLPILKQGKEKRDLPQNIVLRDPLMTSRLNRIRWRFFYLLKSLKRNIFYKEIYSNKVNRFVEIKPFLLAISRYEMFYELWDAFLSKEVDIEKTIIYTYWHTESTYALQALQDKYKYKLVSRIHRGDLYREYKLGEYMPLKKCFTNNIDKIFTITESANIYLEKIYKFHKEKLAVSRLGVSDYQIQSKNSEKGYLHVVSCAFLTEVKQIDKIIKALKELSEIEENIVFKWTHIGNGPLEVVLKQMAHEMLQNKSNIEYQFLGALENKDVYTFYENTKVDVFLNTSQSEGVPVSIMEAMSCYIPIIAPDIGGVSDMVIDNYNGFLLSSSCNVFEVVEALSRVEALKEKTMRDNAYKIYLEKYNAKTNYQNFIEAILKV